MKNFRLFIINQIRRNSMINIKKVTLILILLAIISMLIYSETIKGDEIIKKINEGKAVIIENSDIRGDIDFRKVNNFTIKKKINGIFKSEKEYTYHIKVPIILRNCKVYGKVIGYYYDDFTKTLYKTNFNEKVEFKGTTFYSDVYFKYTEFFKDSDFSKSEFNGKSLFKYAKFDGKANFSFCKYENDANFKYAKFRFETDFSNSDFFDTANFKFARFYDLSIFKKSTFEGEANFKYTKFQEFVDFSDSKFIRTANFKFTKFYSGLSFENTLFEKGVNFKYTRFTSPFKKKGLIIKGPVDLKYAKFNGKSLNYYFFTQNN